MSDLPFPILQVRYRLMKLAEGWIIQGLYPDDPKTWKTINLHHPYEDGNKAMVMLEMFQTIADRRNRK